MAEVSQNRTTIKQNMHAELFLKFQNVSDLGELCSCLQTAIMGTCYCTCLFAPPFPKPNSGHDMRMMLEVKIF